MAELAKRARLEMVSRRPEGVFLGSRMKLARVSVAPMAFSQAMTARGTDVVRPSIPFPITGAMNFRMLGPTAQVTYTEFVLRKMVFVFSLAARILQYLRSQSP